MDDALHRAGWILIVAICAAYATYYVADAVFNHAKDPMSQPMEVRDEIRKNEHHLTGTVYVSSTCNELKVSTRQISQNQYELLFETWPDPAVQCDRKEVARPFDALVFAPAIGIHFIATLDKNPLSIAVYTTIKDR